MARYYALVSGLPNISVEATRLPLTQADFYDELVRELSPADLRFLAWLRYETQHAELIRLYREGYFTPNDSEEYTPLPSEEDEQPALFEELRRVAWESQVLGKVNVRPQVYPAYMHRFIEALYPYQSTEAEGANATTTTPKRSEEDLLAGYYYAEAVGQTQGFVSAWFRFNQTLRNTLTLFTCRKLGWDPEDYLVGSTEVEEALLTSKAKDFELGERFPYFAQLLQVAGEEDIARRERQIDLLKWTWLDEATETKLFEVDNVLAYYLRLGIIERWTRLNPTQGEAVFRGIVQGLKHESSVALQQFKNNTRMR